MSLLIQGDPGQVGKLVLIVLRSQKMHNFKFQFSHVGGCGGQPLRSKSILKVKTQIPIPKEHAQITFLNLNDCFLSQMTIYNFPTCPGSPCNITMVF